MIAELIMTVLFGLARLVMAIIPDLSRIEYLPNSDSFIYILSTAGFILFPSWMFTAIILNVAFWLVVQVNWAIAEWVYKKIPGVN